MPKLPAHAVVNFELSVTYIVYSQIRNMPATVKLAMADENKHVNLLAFFPASQKTLRVI